MMKNVKKNDDYTIDISAFELAIVMNDLSKLTPEERHKHYFSLCKTMGINPLSQPFEYIILNGKLKLYAKKECTEQLRKINQVSVVIESTQIVNGLYIVRAKATADGGRFDESIGAVYIDNLKGEALANAFMKAETKAKRRVTLSICGFGFLDETEVETIPGAKIVDINGQPKKIERAPIEAEEVKPIEKEEAEPDFSRRIRPMGPKIEPWELARGGFDHEAGGDEEEIKMIEDAWKEKIKLDKEYLAKQKAAQKEELKIDEKWMHEFDSTETPDETERLGNIEAITKMWAAMGTSPENVKIYLLKYNIKSINEVSLELSRNIFKALEKKFQEFVKKQEKAE